MPPATTRALSFMSAPALPRAPRRTGLRTRKPAPRASHAAAAAPGAEPVANWRRLHARDRCLRLSLSLRNGQAFRWHAHGTQSFSLAHGGVADEYSGAVGDRLYQLRQAHAEPPCGTDDPVWYRVLSGEAGRDAERALAEYLRLDDDQTALVARLCQTDARFNSVFPYLRGVRVLRQPPEECLFAFICSANNNLPRIAKMVRFLGSRYGQMLGAHHGVEHFRFPDTEELAERASEEELRAAGFGYRAKYIVATARELRRLAREAGEGCGGSVGEMVMGWRGLPREEVEGRLTRLAGIGRKVAGCIALFSLDKLGEVPCDTHIWQIAARDMPEIRERNLTNKVYDEIGAFFRGRFGEDTAGIAQTILFTAELPEFAKLLPSSYRLERVKRKVKSKQEGLVKEEGGVRGEVKEEDCVDGEVKTEGFVKEEGVFVKEEKVFVKEEDLIAVEQSAKRRKANSGARRKARRVKR